MTTQDANGLDLGRAPDQAVLRARVTDDAGHGVGGLAVTLTLSSSLTDLSTVPLTTDDAGDVAYPLTGLDPRTSLEVQQASMYTVTFSSDGTYCSAADTSSMSIGR